MLYAIDLYQSGRGGPPEYAREVGEVARREHLSVKTAFAETLRRLARSLLSLDVTAPTAGNLIRDFCGTGFRGILFEAARRLRTVLASSVDTRTAMLRSEWEAHRSS